MRINIADVIRTKSVEQWCQIVDSYYEARDADGYVRHPNWVVCTPRFDPDGEWSGLDEMVDLVPALPDEIPPPHSILPRGLANGPMDVQTVAARLGYQCDRYEFRLDFSGAYTAAFIRHHRSESR
ncbi:Uncharacterised protein [Mycobacteroides abscessus subsp. massiliense]|uniref:hypothetical protein n=1 Tax=Mycobacteroides abscessus TaxID=36809 RepID=UPI0009A70739|nr:hypothetical protein [Mycobacteroides abscessus]SKK91672.1 Uncharacterised protein [Mycobacteroides abscessus subsp. massiliense]